MKQKPQGSIRTRPQKREAGPQEPYASQTH